MSFTNQTEHYGLPQWLGTDTPDWASDVNGAFTEIDTQMHLNAEQEAGNTSLISALGTQVESLSGQVSDALGHITEDNALLKEIEAQHKINTQHIADLQEDLQEETGAREAGDTRLEGLITATNNTLEEVNQQVAGFQSGMEAAEAKIAQNKADITALELKDGQHDTAITRAQETADTATATAGQNASNISTLQTEVSENAGDITRLQADVTNLNKLRNLRLTGNNQALLVTYSGTAFYFNITAKGDILPGIYYATVETVDHQTSDYVSPDISFSKNNKTLIMSAVRFGITYGITICVLSTIRTNEKLIQAVFKDNGANVDTSTGRLKALYLLELSTS